MASIFGYDIVLSLKETTIQSQLQILYETTVEKKRLPLLDASGNPVGKPPKQRYLISHDLKATAKTDQNDSILNAYISCPVIHLSSGSNQQAAIKITFCQDESQSSTIYFWDGKEKKDVVLDNWTMSWVCDISSRRIENVIEDLIKPSKDDSRPVSLMPSVRKGLENIVSSSKRLLISSLFCALESHTLASSFVVLDSQGKKVDTGVYVALKGLMMSHVDSLASAAAPGIPTTDNPFVLGYGIVQDPVAIAKGAQPTPSAFMPHGFELCVSPASGSQPAALNYLMRTQHSSEDGPDEPSDLDGLKNFIYSSAATPEAFSGAMILSRLLVRGNLTGKMLSRKFFDALDPTSIMNVDLLKYGKTTDELVNRKSTSEPSTNKSWKCREEFQRSYKRHENSWFFNLETDHGDQKVSGVREVDGVLSSEPQTGNADSLHRLFLTFDITLTYDAESNYNGSAFKQSKEIHVSLKYRVTLTISSGEDGRWFFEIDKGRSVLPEINDGKVNLRQEMANSRLGAFAWGSSFSQTPGHGMDMTPNFYSSEMIQNLPDLQALSDGQLAALMNAFTDALPALNQTVLMPAGDVYTFNGLDVTDEGFVISRIKYRTQSKGKTN